MRRSSRASTIRLARCSRGCRTGCRTTRRRCAEAEGRQVVAVARAYEHALGSAAPSEKPKAVEITAEMKAKANDVTGSEMIQQPDGVASEAAQAMAAWQGVPSHEQGRGGPGADHPTPFIAVHRHWQRQAAVRRVHLRFCLQLRLLLAARVRALQARAGGQAQGWPPLTSSSGSGGRCVRYRGTAHCVTWRSALAHGVCDTCSVLRSPAAVKAGVDAAHDLVERPG